MCVLPSEELTTETSSSFSSLKVPVRIYTRYDWGVFESRLKIILGKLFFKIQTSSDPQTSLFCTISGLRVAEAIRIFLGIIHVKIFNIIAHFAAYGEQIGPDFAFYAPLIHFGL